MRKLIIKSTIMIALFCGFILSFNGIIAKAEERPVVIKVGYTLNYGTVKSPMVIGEEGYGYEYLNEIFDHVDGDYELEFVYCEWLEVVNMLENGEIDIFGPITYSETTAESFLLSEESFGDNFIFLSTLSSNVSNYNDYSDIEGSTIAVQANNPNEYLLLEFLEENELEVEIVYFTEDDYEKVMDEGYDFCLCSSLQSYMNLTPVVNLGVVDAYYVTTLDNTELMDTINEGMASVDKSEYMYQEKLYLEYYDYSILSELYITEDEYTLLQSKGTYYIGIEDIYGPVGYKNEDGEFQGVAVDVMNMIAEMAGIEYEFVEITETSIEELAELDFAFMSYDDEIAEKMVKSTTYCEMPYILVDHVMDDGEEIVNVGVLTHYGLAQDEYQGYVYEREVVEYDSLLDMQEAYNNGGIGSMILTTSNMNMIRGEFSDDNYQVATLDMNLNLCLLYSEDYSKELIDIFDKIIAQLDSRAVSASVMEHSTVENTSIELEDILKEYPYAILATVIFIFVLIIGESNLVAKQKRNYLSELLNYDKLTGLCSGHKFGEDVKQILEKESKKFYSIVTIDIDHFKYVNDVFGYEVGNIVIQKVAGCVEKIAPKSVVIARDSGDIFLVLLEKEQSLEHKLIFDDCDRNTLFEEISPYIGETYKLSFSIGIYDIIDRTLDINFMIDCANIARLDGKGSAYTTIVKYDDRMDKQRVISTEMISNMVQAINNHEFVVYYQPKVCLSNQKMIGAEALIRWQKGDGLIPPNDFIPLFEKNGFIQRLDMYVLEDVCAFIEMNPTVPKISVNLSGITIMRKRIAEEILELVSKYVVPHEKLEFEITETALVDEFEQVVESLDKLRAKGFTISIDDFGVGISCLSRLNTMPIDVLKIDREFIWDSIGKERKIEVLKNIINLSEGLKLEIIAEGIETKEQEELLLQLGCKLGQGYLYAPPLRVEDFMKII